MDLSEAGPMGTEGPAAAGAPQLSAEFPGQTIGARVAAKNALKRLDAIFILEPPSEEELSEVDKELSKKGGVRQRGGDAESDKRRAENIAFVKAVAMMMLYNAGQLAEAAAEPTKAYLTREIITPLLGTTGRLAKIALGLAEQVAVKTPVTLTMLTTAGLGYTANVAAKIIQKFNTWGRATSKTLLSDTAAKAAADAAVADVKSIAKTAAVGAFAANQLGLLPLSAVLAAIFYSVQINLGTGTGRAYVISSFYAWYLTQPEGNQKQIDKYVRDYADKAKEAAAGGAEAVKNAVTVAAKELGPLLSAKASTEPAEKPSDANVNVSGKNAFEVIAEAAGGTAPETAEAANADGPTAAAFMTEGAPAAAVAAAKQEAAVAEIAPPPEPAAAAPAPAPAPRIRRTGTGPIKSDYGERRIEASDQDTMGRRSTRSRGSTTPGSFPDELSPEPTPRTVGRIKKGSGGGKTRGKKSKRRVTRRKPRKTATVKFAY